MLRNTRSLPFYRGDLTTVLHTTLAGAQHSPVIAESLYESSSLIQVLGDCGIKGHCRRLVVAAELENDRRCRLHNHLLNLPESQTSSSRPDTPCTGVSSKVMLWTLSGGCRHLIIWHLPVAVRGARFQRQTRKLHPRCAIPTNLYGYSTGSTSRFPHRSLGWMRILTPLKGTLETSRATALKGAHANTIDGVAGIKRLLGPPCTQHPPHQRRSFLSVDRSLVLAGQGLASHQDRLRRLDFQSEMKAFEMRLAKTVRRPSRAIPTHALGVSDLHIMTKEWCGGSVWTRVQYVHIVIRHRSCHFKRWEGTVDARSVRKTRIRYQVSASNDTSLGPRPLDRAG